MQTHQVWMTLALLAGNAVAAPPMAQLVYKCGSTYSQVPCPGAASVDVTDTRTPAQKAQTDTASMQAARLAAQLEKDRLALEKASTPKPTPSKAAKPSSNAPGSDKLPVKAATKTRKPPPDYFVAAVRPDKKETGKPGAAPSEKGNFAVNK